ncbi:MAG TPA: UvrD-helicase domain-containing protein [Solirubrobacterales bacterium]|jgi:ATP-dependent exoDNAse (exonuclease V) beta subunit|nr:UvrD-helicase domain-containing protein [Solirubrobacterales bacterium]
MSDVTPNECAIEQTPSGADAPPTEPAATGASTPTDASPPEPAVERSPTPEQRAAIEARAHDVLLEAGAGSGKTGVMVERYTRLVVDEGVSPDAVLAFTFTDKAAAELRARVRAELSRRAAGTGAAAVRAAGLLSTMGGAWITTIHGFCNRVLAAHPVAAGVDPGFRVLDQPEAERAARESFDAALTEFLAGADPDREETVAAYDLEGLRGVIVATHDELRSRGVAEPALPDPPQADPAEALAAAIEVAGECLEELKEGDAKRLPLEEAIARLTQPGPPPPLAELEALRPGGTAKALAPFRDAIDAAISRAAEAGDGGVAYRHIAALLRLYTDAFEDAKARRAGIDFEDLQILAARLLERAEIGQAYRGRFSHLLVDEFQDTNRLQLRLIEALQGPKSQLVVVGDELQSIYSFRHADLEVFRRRREQIDAAPDAELMRLSGNFRSRPEVIAAVNLLGSTLLGAAYRPLTVGAPPSSPAPRGPGPAVEIHLTSRDGWDEEGIDLEPAIDGRTPLNCLAEARTLATRLRELHEAGVERGSMVVLLRAFTHLDAYEDSLARAGLRPYVVGGRGYWSQQQVADVCALLATIANPLDDEALFGALASPACAVAPDTLWLLRAAAGRRRHVWPALEALALAGEAELAEPERLEQIPAEERALLVEFATGLVGLRARAPRLSLAGLVEAAVTETGYDLATLLQPSGEARLANVRKLSRLAAAYESREGRDLRGLLDFLAARAETDTEAQAATGAEGHDGVRIMTVHNAKGLEFEVVAVPDLARGLLSGGRRPVLALGREQPPKVGLQWRRLGRASLNLYDYGDLIDAGESRDSEEGLRLFHVAATRARERLILSGVVKPEPARETKPGTAVIERIVSAFGLDRPKVGEPEPAATADAATGDAARTDTRAEVASPPNAGPTEVTAGEPHLDSEVPVPPAEARPGLDETFPASFIAVHANVPSPERAAELRNLRLDAATERPLGAGTPPLVERKPPIVPSRPLSYTAISAFEECAYRFYMERVLGLPSAASTDRVRSNPRIARISANSPVGDGDEGPSAREERSARGAAVHALLEWSLVNDWSEPTAELARRHALAAGLDLDAAGAEELLGPVRDWLGSPLRAEIAAATRVRAEVPILLSAGSTVLRGSIDLLVERDGLPPLVVDYKTDRLRGDDPAARADHYEVQRSIYALAAKESLGATEVEVAYVFLERADSPVRTVLTEADMTAGRARIEAAVASISAGNFEPAPEDGRGWDLCRGCPAVGRLCSGPRQSDTPA